MTFGQQLNARHDMRCVAPQPIPFELAAMSSKAQIWGNHLGESPDDLMLRFCAGRDVTPLPMADEVLLPFDLWTNRAHAMMLHRQGILPAELLRRILTALDGIATEWAEEAFQLDPALEDVHINVEAQVSRRAGPEAGGRLHTGRSRNDQVACDMRLFLREALLGFAEGVAALGDTLLEQAAVHQDTVMPGFTHHQPAMITTWGHWVCGYVQALCRDLERLQLAFTQVNRNPLGAAASFGTSWPIDREYTTELLGFAAVEANTLDAISARWEQEAHGAFAYSMAMNHMAVMAQDLILLSHPYWDMLRLPDRYVTGSSIMPQKRNPDVAEVIKGKSAWLQGMVGGLLALPKGGMSGYNRDSQMTKYAILDVVRECQPAPLVLAGLMGGLEVRVGVMRERLNQGFLTATDFADALARELGLPFRACYDITADAVGRAGDAGRITEAAARDALQAAGHDPAAAAGILADLADPARVLAWRRHTGAPSPEAVTRQIAALRGTLAQVGGWIVPARDAIATARERCKAAGREI